MLVKEINEMKEELRKWNMEDLEKKIKSLQSLKCRLKKIEKRKKEMEDVLEKERIIREVIIEKSEKKVSIYEREEEEIKVMNVEEVLRGIKNIDSILCIEKSKDKMNEEKIEKCNKVRVWLVERKEEVEGNNKGNVKISDVLRKMEDCKSLEDLKIWLLDK
jgi:hypothetical protein